MFRLSDYFLEQYKNKQPNWGPLGYVVAKRTYCRNKGNGEVEEWWEVLKRVVEGEFEIQRKHCIRNGLFWDEDKAQNSAQETFKLMWDFKFLPPGRGLWMMGTDFIEKHGSMALNNCGFISTLNVDKDPARPFTWAMNALMLGVGIGFDLRGHGKMYIYNLIADDGDVHVIEDSREGWVEALKLLIEGYTVTMRRYNFDYSKIRPKGEPIKGFGGVASGPEPLKEMIDNIEEILKSRMGTYLMSVDIMDIFNNIGKCVVAGNVRRSAQIAIGFYNDLDFIYAKTYEDKVKELRWASNNSVFGFIGMNYDILLESIKKNGEPGIIYLDNIRKYGRMIDKPNYKDMNAMGVNPCFSGEERLLCVPEGEETPRYVEFKKLLNQNIKVYTPWHDLVPAKVVYNGLKPVYKVCIQNKYSISEILVTEDHNFMLLNGEACKAIDLVGKKIRFKGFQKQNFVYKDVMLGKKNKYINLLDHDPASLLRGRFGRLGFVKYGKYIQYKAVDIKDAIYVKKLLEDYFDIRSMVIYNKPFVSDTNIVEIIDVDLIINDFQSILSFYINIGFYTSKKNEQLEKLLEYRTPIVYKVEYFGVVDVYDFIMKSVHWGIVNDYVVHNCGEQALEDGELCTLVETFPSMHEDLNDYLHTLKYAYLYGKTVTLINTNDSDTNRVMNKNRRMGISQTGIIDAFVKHGRSEMLKWCDIGYKYLRELDEKYSREWLSVPTSIKLTSVKPSGSVSLLPGVSPGIHYPHSEYYIRRIRFSSNHELLDVLRESGYNVYPDPYGKGDNGESYTYVVDFPVHEKYFTKSKSDVSIWEQVINVIDYQRYWSDNQVSVTVTFKPHEAKDIKYVLEASEDKIKAITFLPLFDHNYPAAPYETITKEQYEEMVSKIKPIFKEIHTAGEGESGCATDVCELKFEISEIKND